VILDLHLSFGTVISKHVNFHKICCSCYNVSIRGTNRLIPAVALEAPKFPQIETATQRKPFRPAVVSWSFFFVRIPTKLKVNVVRIVPMTISSLSLLKLGAVIQIALA